MEENARASAVFSEKVNRNNRFARAEELKVNFKFAMLVQHNSFMICSFLQLDCRYRVAGLVLDL